MTKYTQQDYNWVLKIVKHRPGISRKEIVQISQEESEGLGLRPRDEKPPGRDKISKILDDGDGTHWDYVKGGGRSKTSSVVSRKRDSLAALDALLTYMKIREEEKRLDEIHDRRHNKLVLVDLLEMIRIQHVIISYPMHAYYSNNLSDCEREQVFQIALETAKKQLDRIETIERIQKNKYDDYGKIRNAIDKLHHSDLIISEVLHDRKNYKEYLKYRNFLRQRFKLMQHR